MNVLGAAKQTLKSRRFWAWQIGGAILYGIPVAIRFITRSQYIPILSYPGDWVWHFIPGNLVEKFLVNAFFPGGAGAVAGEIFFSNYKGEAVRGKNKYKARLVGAMAETAAWTAFQFAGYLLFIIGPFGGNLFEAWYVYPFNFFLAALSVFTADIVGLVKAAIGKARQKISSRNHN